jgi:hypothetical protein
MRRERHPVPPLSRCKGALLDPLPVSPSQPDGGVPSPTKPSVNAREGAHVPGIRRAHQRPPAPLERRGILCPWQPKRSRHSIRSSQRSNAASKPSPKTSPKFAKTWRRKTHAGRYGNSPRHQADEVRGERNRQAQAARSPRRRD